MPVIKLDDGHGHNLNILDTDGYRTSTFGNPDATSTRVREMKSFKCRPDDVFVCAAPKSGTHWSWEIVNMMLQRKAETIPKSKVSHMLEAAPWDMLASLPSPRVLNTHVNYSMLPKEAKEMGCKILYMLRNPKDVAVSLYHHVSGLRRMFEYDGEWEHFLPLFLDGKLMYNSWFEYVLEWEEAMNNVPNLPILQIYFEDLKQNSLEEVYKIGRFFGVENTNNLFEAISEKCQFENMVKDKQQYMAPPNATLGGFSFYRKGIVGDWINWFTVAQSEMFDQVYNEKMKSSNHKFKYSTT